jgi:hypothetical protein
MASIRIVDTQLSAGAGLAPGQAQDFNFDLTGAVQPVGVAFSVQADSGFPTNLVLQDTRFLQSTTANYVVVANVKNAGPTASRFGVTLTVIEA